MAGTPPINVTVVPEFDMMPVYEGFRSIAKITAQVHEAMAAEARRQERQFDDQIKALHAERERAAGGPDAER